MAKQKSKLAECFDKAKAAFTAPKNLNYRTRPGLVTALENAQKAIKQRAKATGETHNAATSYILQDVFNLFDDIQRQTGVALPEATEKLEIKKGGEQHGKEKGQGRQEMLVDNLPQQDEYDDLDMSYRPAEGAMPADVAGGSSALTPAADIKPVDNGGLSGSLLDDPKKAMAERYDLALGLADFVHVKLLDDPEYKLTDADKLDYMLRLGFNPEYVAKRMNEAATGRKSEDSSSEDNMEDVEQEAAATVKDRSSDDENDTDEREVMSPDENWYSVLASRDILGKIFNYRFGASASYKILNRIFDDLKAIQTNRNAGVKPGSASLMFYSPETFKTWLDTKASMYKAPAFQQGEALLKTVMAAAGYEAAKGMMRFYLARNRVMSVRAIVKAGELSMAPDNALDAADEYRSLVETNLTNVARWDAAAGGKTAAHRAGLIKDLAAKYSKAAAKPFKQASADDYSAFRNTQGDMHRGALATNMGLPYFLEWLTGIEASVWLNADRHKNKVNPEQDVLRSITTSLNANLVGRAAGEYLYGPKGDFTSYKSVFESAKAGEKMQQSAFRGFFAQVANDAFTSAHKAAGRFVSPNIERLAKQQGIYQSGTASQYQTPEGSDAFSHELTRPTVSEFELYVASGPRQMENPDEQARENADHALAKGAKWIVFSGVDNQDTGRVKDTENAITRDVNNYVKRINKEWFMPQGKYFVNLIMGEKRAVMGVVIDMPSPKGTYEINYAKGRKWLDSIVSGAKTDWGGADKYAKRSATLNTQMVPILPTADGFADGTVNVVVYKDDYTYDQLPQEYKDAIGPVPNPGDKYPMADGAEGFSEEGYKAMEAATGSRSEGEAKKVFKITVTGVHPGTQQAIMLKGAMGNLASGARMGGHAGRLHAWVAAHNAANPGNIIHLAVSSETAKAWGFPVSEIDGAAQVVKVPTYMFGEQTNLNTSTHIHDINVASQLPADLQFLENKNEINDTFGKMLDKAIAKLKLPPLIDMIHDMPEIQQLLGPDLVRRYQQTTRDWLMAKAVLSDAIESGNVSAIDFARTDLKIMEEDRKKLEQDLRKMEKSPYLLARRDQIAAAYVRNRLGAQLPGAHIVAAPATASPHVHDSKRMPEGWQHAVVSMHIADAPGGELGDKAYYGEYRDGVTKQEALDTIAAGINAMDDGARYDLIAPAYRSMPYDQVKAEHLANWELRETVNPDTRHETVFIPGSFVVINRTPGTGFESHILARLGIDPGAASGNASYIHSETVRRAGVDFDGDKWAAYLQTYKQFGDYDRAAPQNAFIEAIVRGYEKIDEAIIKNTIDTGKYKTGGVDSYGDELKAELKALRDQGIYNPATMDRINQMFWDSKKALGIFVASVSNLSFGMTTGGLMLKKAIRLTDGLTLERTALDPKWVKSDLFKRLVYGTITNIIVDNGKDPQAEKLQINPYTTNLLILALAFSRPITATDPKAADAESRKLLFEIVKWLKSEEVKSFVKATEAGRSVDAAKYTTRQQLVDALPARSRMYKAAWKKNVPTGMGLALLDLAKTGAGEFFKISQAIRMSKQRFADSVKFKDLGEVLSMVENNEFKMFNTTELAKSDIIKNAKAFYKAYEDNGWNEAEHPMLASYNDTLVRNAMRPHVSHTKEGASIDSSVEVTAEEAKKQAARTRPELTIEYLEYADKDASPEEKDAASEAVMDARKNMPNSTTSAARTRQVWLINALTRPGNSDSWRPEISSPETLASVLAPVMRELKEKNKGNAFAEAFQVSVPDSKDPFVRVMNKGLAELTSTELEKIRSASDSLVPPTGWTIDQLLHGLGALSAWQWGPSTRSRSGNYIMAMPERWMAKAAELAADEAAMPVAAMPDIENAILYVGGDYIRAGYKMYDPLWSKDQIAAATIPTAPATPGTPSNQPESIDQQTKTGDMDSLYAEYFEPDKERMARYIEAEMAKAKASPHFAGMTEDEMRQEVEGMAVDRFQDTALNVWYAIGDLQREQNTAAREFVAYLRKRAQVEGIQEGMGYQVGGDAGSINARYAMELKLDGLAQRLRELPWSQPLTSEGSAKAAQVGSTEKEIPQTPVAGPAVGEGRGGVGQGEQGAQAPGAPASQAAEAPVTTPATAPKKTKKTQPAGPDLFATAATGASAVEEGANLFSEEVNLEAKRKAAENKLVTARKGTGGVSSKERAAKFVYETKHLLTRAEQETELLSDLGTHIARPESGARGGELDELRRFFDDKGRIAIPLEHYRQIFSSDATHTVDQVALEAGYDGNIAGFVDRLLSESARRVARWEEQTRIAKEKGLYFDKWEDYEEYQRDELAAEAAGGGLSASILTRDNVGSREAWRLGSVMLGYPKDSAKLKTFMKNFNDFSRKIKQGLDKTVADAERNGVDPRYHAAAAIRRIPAVARFNGSPYVELAQYKSKLWSLYANGVAPEAVAPFDYPPKSEHLPEKVKEEPKTDADGNYMLPGISASIPEVSLEMLHYVNPLTTIGVHGVHQVLNREVMEMQGYRERATNLFNRIYKAYGLMDEGVLYSMDSPNLLRGSKNLGTLTPEERNMGNQYVSAITAILEHEEAYDGRTKTWTAQVTPILDKMEAAIKGLDAAAARPIIEAARKRVMEELAPKIKIAWGVPIWGSKTKKARTGTLGEDDHFMMNGKHYIAMPARLAGEGLVYFNATDGVLEYRNAAAALRNLAGDVIETRLQPMPDVEVDVPDAQPVEALASFLERFNNSTYKGKLEDLRTRGLRSEEDVDLFGYVRKVHATYKSIPVFAKFITEMAGYGGKHNSGLGFQTIEMMAADKKVKDQLKLLPKTIDAAATHLPQGTTEFQSRFTPTERPGATSAQIALYTSLVGAKEVSDMGLDFDKMTVWDLNAAIIKELKRRQILQAEEKGDAYKVTEDNKRDLATIAKLEQTLSNYKFAEWTGRELGRARAGSYARIYSNREYDREVKDANGNVRRYRIRPATLNAADMLHSYVSDVSGVAMRRHVIKAFLLTPDLDNKPLVIAVPSKISEQASLVNEELLRETVMRLHNQYPVQLGNILTMPIDEALRKAEDVLMSSGEYVRVESPFVSIQTFVAKKGDAATLLKHIAQEQAKYVVMGVDVLEQLGRIQQWGKMTSVGFSAFFLMSNLETAIAGTGFKNNFLRHPIQNFKALYALMNRITAYDPDIARWESLIARAGIDIGKEAAIGHSMGIVTRDREVIGQNATKLMGPEMGAKAMKVFDVITGKAFTAAFFGEPGKHAGIFKALKLWATQEKARAVARAEAIAAGATEAEAAGAWESLPETDQLRILKSISDFINAAYGGPFWDKYIWATPQMRQMLNLLMFAPAWTLAAWEIAGGGLLTGRLMGNYISSAQTRKDIMMNWAVMGSIVMFALPNALQFMIWGVGGGPDDPPFTFLNEEGRKSYVDITPFIRHMPGYTGDPTGKRREYMRWGKQAYEVVDGWLVEPINQFLRKLSQPAKIVLEQVTGRSPGSDWNLEFAGKGLAGFLAADRDGEKEFLTSRFGYVVQKFLPMSILNAIKNPEMALVGAFAPVSKGKSAGAATAELVIVLNTAANENNWKEFRKFPNAKANLIGLGDNTLQAAAANGYDVDKIVNTAKGVVLSGLYKKFLNAMSSSDTDAMHRISNQILRVGGTLKGLKQSAMNKRVQVGKDKQATPEEDAAMAAAFGEPVNPGTP